MDQQMLTISPSQQPPTTRYMNQRDKILMYQLNQYYLSKATTRSSSIAKTIQEVVKIVQDVLRELEIQEPRFISTFTEVNGHYDGMFHTIFCSIALPMMFNRTSWHNILSYHSSKNLTIIGLNVVSSTEFEVILFLNQMGVFNFVDDGSLPGCAVLKLSDGRKRSMSLWVEFITASGYLSARKIRSRFQTLVSFQLSMNSKSVPEIVARPS